MKPRILSVLGRCLMELLRVDDEMNTALLPSGHWPYWCWNQMFTFFVLMFMIIKCIILINLFISLPLSSFLILQMHYNQDLFVKNIGEVQLMTHWFYNLMYLMTIIRNDCNFHSHPPENELFLKNSTETLWIYSVSIRRTHTVI